MTWVSNHIKIVLLNEINDVTRISVVVENVVGLVYTKIISSFELDETHLRKLYSFEQSLFVPFCKANGLANNNEVKIVDMPLKRFKVCINMYYNYY